MARLEILGLDVKALAGWLLVGGVAASCATEDAEPVAVTRQATQSVDQCVSRGGTEDCPDEVTGNCGAWSCEPLVLVANCEFTPSRAGLSGAACASEATIAGLCGPVPRSQQHPEFYACCGCFDRDLCQPGTSSTACGIRGTECKRCGACQTCKEGECVPADEGVSCGTCRECRNGTCAEQSPGTACPNGRCASGGVCCTGCRDANNQCVTSNNDHCGSGGDACVTCNQCQNCTNGACAARTGSCNDNNACTVNDTCSNGTCSGAAGPGCDDGNPCTTDACSPLTGCSFTSGAEGATCDDGNTCSTGDRCTDHDADPLTARVCRATGGTLCDDPPTPCRATQCDANTGECPYPNLPDGTGCTTSNRCVINEACDDGDCVGEPRVCDDGNPCTDDSCEPSSSATDVDPVTGCRFVPNTDDCDDGNSCTTGDACADGECSGTAMECDAPRECLLDGACDPGTGNCTYAFQPDGTACETTGQCQDGVCDGGTIIGDGGEGGETGGAGADNAGAGGGSGTGGSGTGGTAAGGSGNQAGDDGTGATGTSGASSGELFKRDPGGCACRAPGTTAPNPANSLAWLAGALVFAARRRSVRRRERSSTPA